jgi:hypothetical protein
METIEPTETECAIAYLTYEFDRINNLLFAVTFSEDWKQYTVPEQIAFRNMLEVLGGVSNLHREKFDADVWKGRANGTVDPSVTSIRKEREGDKPGRKAEPVTAASLLAKRLKK